MSSFFRDLVYWKQSPIYNYFLGRKIKKLEERLNSLSAYPTTRVDEEKRETLLEQVMYQLLQIKDPRCDDIFIRVLTHRFEIVRLCAFMGLIERGTATTTKLLRAFEDSTQTEQIQILKILQRTKDPEALIPIINLRTSGNISREVEEECLSFTFVLMSKKGISVAVESLGNLDDEVTQMVVSMALNLDSLGPEYIEPLMKAAENGNNETKEAVYFALAKIGEPAAEALVGLVEIGEGHVQELAVKGLDKLGKTELLSKETWLSLLSNISVGSHAVTALAKLGTSIVLDLLDKLLTSDNEIERKHVAMALSKIAEFGDRVDLVAVHKLLEKRVRATSSEPEAKKKATFLYELVARGVKKAIPKLSTGKLSDRKPKPPAGMGGKLVRVQRVGAR